MKTVLPKTLFTTKRTGTTTRTTALLALLFVVFSNTMSFGQTNSYLGLSGGLEAGSVVNATTNANAVATNWTKSTATATIANETTTVRSGVNSLRVNSVSATLCRVFSPAMTITASTQVWTVQYYKRAASTTNAVQSQAGFYRNTTESSNGTYAGVTTANTWEKVTFSPAAATSATTASAVMLVKQLGTGGDTFYDDFAVYEGGVDNTAAAVPGAFSFSGQTGSSIGVSWGAASGGVDGGGYLVVRGTVDPTTAPNANGIYATTNAIGSGTVVYQGTGTSFTDSGLAAGTTYFYRVYTYDKAYNYSAATTGSSATAAGNVVNGVIGTNEYGVHTNGNNQQSSATGTWYMSWDATNLYIAATGGTTTEAGVLYLDKNAITPVNGGTNADGSLVGQNYDGSSFANLQFRADMVVYFKSGYNEYRLADGAGGWGTAVTTSTSAVAGTTREIAIPWSALGGRPASFNWFGYIAYAGGGAYASVPTENPGSGGGLTIGASARWDRYYTVSDTTVGAGTLPFSRNSYTFTSASDVSSFGAISAYDFTMNSSGRFISRTGNVTGNWTIGGNLTIGAGTIYMGSGGSGYGTTSVAGNLNLLGGSYDMDASTAATSVTGNVSIASGATLKLSTQVGGDLNVTGNWSNAGTFTPSSRLVQFNGSLAQTLTGATSFDYLTLNNALGLTLSNNITVNQTLALTSGKITLGTNNVTALGTVTSSSTNYFVTNSTGQLKQTVGAGAVTFAVGNSAYNPIILNNTGGTSDVYGINVLDGTYATPFDNTKVVNRRWQVSEAVAGGSNLSVVAQYNTADTFGANFTAGTTPLLGLYNGSTWSTVGATAAGANPFTYTSTANSTPSDLTTGTQYFGIGKDNGFLSVATKLVITAISPASPSATDAFTVTVQAQDAYNFPTAVVAGTAFSLTTNGNAGAIGGTVTGTILAATNSITVSGVTLASAGTGVTVTATRTSGDVLAAGTSATFTVLAAPTQLAFVGVPSTGNVGVNLTSFTVEVRRADNSVDTNYIGSVTISKASGTGLLTGTTTATVVAGVATFSAAQFDTASTFTLNANAGSFAQITSGNIVVTLAPVVLAGWDFFGQSSPTTFAATTFNTNLDATTTLSNITRGSGAASSSGGNSFRTTGFQNVAISTSNTAYFQTTLKTKVGYSLNLSSITASVVGTATYSASPGVSQQFAYSLDGTTFTLIGSPVVVSGTTPAAMPTVTTSGVSALQNVPSGTTVYIRYYATGQTNTGGWGFSSATSGTNGLAFNGNIVCIQPTAYAVTGGGTYCPSGTGVAVGLANSQTGVNYQLKIGGTNTGSPVPGTGAAISFGLQTAVGTYTVEGSNTNSPCNYTTTMTGSVAVATYSPATASVISGTASICPGSSTNLQVAITGGTSPYSVVYTDGTSNFTASSYTSGSNISVSPSATKTYTIVSVTDANGCAGTGNSGSAVVTVFTPASASVISGTASTCSGAATNLQVAITGGASPYTLIYTDGTSNFTVSSYTSGANISVSPTTTTTYTIVSVTDANGCLGTGNSGSAVITSGATSTWNGSAWDVTPSSTSAVVFAGNYTAAANLTFCSVSVTSGTVTIPSGFNITLNGAINVSGGSFVLQNNANLVQNTSASNSGNIVVNRNSAAILRQDYTLWSSPVTNSGLFLQAFSPMTLSTRFYTYSPSSNIYVAVSSPATTPFALATSYLIRVANNHNAVTPTVWAGQFTGVPNNGPISLSVTSGTYNATGNPYPSTISADSFISANSITEALYFWRKTNNTAQATTPTTSYATYTTAGGAGTGPSGLGGITPNGTIQVGQGFIAKATSSSLNFTNGMRTTNNSDQFLRTGERSRVWLDLFNANGAVSQLLVAYMPGATLGVDDAIDGRYINDAPTALTSVINNEEFAVQGRPLPFDATDVVPLGFKTPTAGSFTIALNNLDGLFASNNQAVYLKDNLTNTIQDLTAGSYQFATEVGTFNNRFEIVYENLLATQNPTFTENSVVVYQQDQQVVVNTGKTTIAKVQVYDISGRLLVTKSNVNATEVRFAAGTANQVLLVKVTSASGAVVTKKIVN